MRNDETSTYDPGIGWLNNWENERITDDDFENNWTSAAPKTEYTPCKQEKTSYSQMLLFPNDPPAPRRTVRHKRRRIMGQDHAHTR